MFVKNKKIIIINPSKQRLSAVGVCSCSFVGTRVFFGGFLIFPHQDLGFEAIFPHKKTLIV
jgi:hypothetical protein